MASLEPSSGAAPRLVGREREQRLLREAMDDTLHGRGRLVLIGGEAGIGKTALSEALVREATARGALILVGRCYDLMETPPYGPWVDLFGRYQPGHDRPVLPSSFAERGTVREVASQAALFRQVQEFFAEVAASRPIVLLLDDLHWADPASLDLLRALARAISDLPLLMLATYRADEITRRHPLYQLLPVLVREASTTRVALQSLDRADLQALIAGRYRLAAGGRGDTGGVSAGAIRGESLLRIGTLAGAGRGACAG